MRRFPWILLTIRAGVENLLRLGVTGAERAVQFEVVGVVKERSAKTEEDSLSEIKIKSV